MKIKAAICAALVCLTLGALGTSEAKAQPCAWIGDTSAGFGWPPFYSSEEGIKLRGYAPGELALSPEQTDLIDNERFSILSIKVRIATVLPEPDRYAFTEPGPGETHDFIEQFEFPLRHPSREGVRSEYGGDEVGGVRSNERSNDEADEEARATLGGDDRLVADLIYRNPYPGGHSAIPSAPSHHVIFHENVSVSRLHVPSSGEPVKFSFRLCCHDHPGLPALEPGVYRQYAKITMIWPGVICGKPQPDASR